jgi:hypothetical protein
MGKGGAGTSLGTQLGQQVGLGNSFVNPALTGQQPTPQQSPGFGPGVNNFGGGMGGMPQPGNSNVPSSLGGKGGMQQPMGQQGSQNPMQQPAFAQPYVNNMLGGAQQAMQGMLGGQMQPPGQQPDQMMSDMRNTLRGSMQPPGNPGFPDPYVQSQMDSAHQAAMQGMLGGGAMGGAQQAMQQAYPSTSPMQQNTFMQGMLGGGMQPPGQMSNMNSTPRQMPQGGFGGMRGMGNMGGMRNMMGGMGRMGGMMGGMRGPQATPTAMYAEGGLASAAQNMAGRGRDGDSMLVHMSPGEVKGLQALAMAHGGSLSINPNTGLVEASFLKRILPMIAGAGLMMIPGVGPLAAAGMVGGAETLRTGDIGKGLMAGLGAYGGAGLAGNLSGAAASTAVDESARNLANQAIADGSTTAGMAEATRNTATPTLSSIGQGAKQVFSSPEALGQFGKQNLMNIGAAAAPALNDAMTPKAPEMPGTPEEEERYKGSPYRYNLASNFAGSSPARPNPYYTPTGLGYAAQGGSTNDIMMAAGGSYDDEPMGDNSGMAAGGIAGYAAGGLKMGQGIARDTDTDTASLGAYDAAMKRIEKQFAAANLKPKEMPKSGIARLGQIKTVADGGSIGGYSDGGRMLKGPGDGMSDSIPAMIGKRQPARLADGEFVVPADVVSHLGNGSTDAGAKKLYSMMDKIRTARTGKKKQAPAIKTSKYMPA